MLTVLILLVFLLSTGVAVAASQVFSDVPGNHWAAKDIARMKAKGVLGGVSETRYAPNDPVTREMLVVMLARVLGEQGEASGTIPASFVQRDNVSSWATGSMSYAVREGIISGSLLHSDPKGAVSRHEVAEIVVKAMGLTTEANSKQNVILDYFDASSIPLSSRGYVAVMKDKEIMAGSSDGNFNPNDPLTRAQIASVLNRVDNHLQKLTSTTVKGKVFGISSSVLTIENASGVIEPINLASNVLVFRAGGISELTSLNSGEMVEIIKDSGGKVLYIDQGQYQFDKITLEGEITDIVGQTIKVLTIKSNNNTSDTYTLSSSAIIRIDDQNGVASQLAKGQAVTAVISDQSITSIHVSNAQRVINGTITEIDLDDKTITLERTSDLGEIVLNIDNSTEIILSKKEIDLEDLIEEQEVMVIASGTKATRIDVNDLEKTITGILVEISYSPDVTLTILNEDTDKEETYYIDADVSIRRDRNRDLTLRQIYAGDEIDIDLINRNVTSIYATSVEDDAEGTVKEIRLGATPAIVIVTDDGEEKTVPVASDARIRKDGATINLREIEFGDWAELEIEGTQATRVDIEAKYSNRYLIGTVENIHEAAQVIVIYETETRENRQVFWDSDTTVIRNDRTRSVSYLSAKDEVIITGIYEGGLFWARTIVIVSN